MIFTDYISETKSSRPGLDNAMEFVRKGDTLVVWRLDKLGRNMGDLISIVNRLNDCGISFHSLQENITMDKVSSTGQLIFHLFAAFAEFERNLIMERSAAGRVAARASGRYGGGKIIDNRTIIGGGVYKGYSVDVPYMGRGDFLKNDFDGCFEDGNVQEGNVQENDT